MGCGVNLAFSVLAYNPIAGGRDPVTSHKISTRGLQPPGNSFSGSVLSKEIPMYLDRFPY